MPRDRTSGSRLRPLAARRLRAYASGDSLLTAGLIAHYRIQQGADPDIVYDETGSYNATRGLGASYKPVWTASGLNFAGSVQLVNFPAGLSSGIKTDMYCLKSVRTNGDFQNISSGWNQFTDGRFCYGLPGSLTFSPSEVQLGNIIITTTFGTSSAKFYFGERETVSYNDSGNPGKASGWWGFTNFNTGFQGYLYYRLCWNIELTAGQVASQARWLSKQMEARSITLANTASGPYIACIGDSITSGQPGAVDADWPKKLLPLLANPNRIVNYSRSGLTFNELASSIGTHVSALFASHPGGPNVAVIARGTNDILVSGTPAATLLASIAACVTNARAAGATYVITRTIPRTNWTSYRSQVSGDAILEPVNDALVANVGGIYGDAIADTWSTGPLGVGGDTTDTNYYFSDGIHLVTGGHTVIAQAVETALGLVGIT